MSEQTTGSLSDFLAAERTFLAWIRTGLALMGFGFVVARFGLFLQAIQAQRPSIEARAYGPSFWFGTGLIVWASPSISSPRAATFIWCVS